MGAVNFLIWVAMIHYLEMRNVGPMDHLEFSFAPRLNLLTGDNGLGKSFLLDIVWWCMTRFWPSEINRKLTTGLMAYPTNVEKEAWIRYHLEASSGGFQQNSRV